MGTPRLVPPPGPADGRPVLVVVPYAGSGVAPFRDWADALADVATVTAVLLPGREHLFGQPALTSMADVLRGLTPQVEALAPRPVVLFGHSMGAVVAFALARQLRRRGVPPAGLIVSGAGSPCRRDPTDLVHLLDDDALLRRTADFGGMPPQLLADRELLGLFTPVLRADFQVLETWPVDPQPPLALPVTVLRGTGDTTVTDHQADGWRTHTVTDPDEHFFAGGHFFVHTARAEVLRTVADVLAAVPGDNRRSHHPRHR
ncbi:MULTISPECIES: thioesterase II family protein [Micromonospora]|uniref:Surfactin synthase thioesterase subunit n=1 Tax=Micromonospora yangpuensis TaxID=683228 RepID=A0A1C6UNY7_9ACTN|nr:alpha/beta fold hydrolase [Micromonospora yangpuensis]GGM08814.1 thioesterase [Micromonospora yangpuensis]SCL55751.1 Surfactin synthase thioesterase subunit [Micromonospora yangpuensis]